MARISLTEQYNNKDVITQIYDLKDQNQDLEDALVGLSEQLENATSALQMATDEITGLSSQVAGFDTRIDSLEDSVGGQSDTADPDGSVYARIAQNVSDIASNTEGITANTEDIADNTAQIVGIASTVAGHTSVISSLPTEYQARSQKDTLNGYAGLSSAGKIATSQIDTGVNLNQILQAGAQLNTGEFLYIGTGGVIRSRVIGEGVRYDGDFASLAALNAFPDPANGDFATVSDTVSDDGFYMYDGTQWNRTMLFDITDYELVSNKVTGISSASTNDQYPSAKAVYDFEIANDVASMDLSQTTSAGKVTVSASIKNVNQTVLASDSVDIPTTSSVTSGSNVPITSGGVYTGLAGKQNTLVSGTSIKTVNNTSLLGSGNVSVQAVLNADQTRKITISSGSPTGGSDGDIWIQYEV